jgi:hypothetical protein
MAAAGVFKKSNVVWRSSSGYGTAREVVQVTKYVGFAYSAACNWLKNVPYPIERRLSPIDEYAGPASGLVIRLTRLWRVTTDEIEMNAWPQTGTFDKRLVRARTCSDGICLSRCGIQVTHHFNLDTVTPQLIGQIMRPLLGAVPNQNTAQGGSNSSMCPYKPPGHFARTNDKKCFSVWSGKQFRAKSGVCRRSPMGDFGAIHHRQRTTVRTIKQNAHSLNGRQLAGG